MRPVPVALMLCTAVVAMGGCAPGSDDSVAAGARPVVLIVVDALRADHLGTYGYRARDTSPNLDRWAERGLVYERAWATSSWTLPSFGSILTGHLPSAHGAGVEVAGDAGSAFEVAAARNFVVLPEGVPTLAATLGAQGYATGAFVANPFLDPRFGLGNGFDYYDHDDADNVAARRAADTVDLALGWIDARAEDQPFFVMVHLMDPHLNYDAPEPFGGRFTGELGGDFELPVKGLWPIRNRAAEITAAERTFIAAAYDEEIAYVDAEVGRLLDALEQRGVLESGLVLLTSDHGEELFDHGGFEHGHSMYEEVLRVPLILWGGMVSSGRSSTPVSLIDIAPTVLEATGLVAAAPERDVRDTVGAGPGRPEGSAAEIAAEDAGGAPGVSLLDAERVAGGAQRTIVAERLLYGPATKAVVRWPYKAIVVAEGDAGAVELFDLTADPGEQTDLAAQRPDALADLLAALAERLAAAEALGVAVEAEVDEALLRRLRALGYIR